MGTGAHSRGVVGPTLAAFAGVGVLIVIVFAFLLGTLNTLAGELETLGREEAPGAELRSAADQLERAWRATRRALRDRVG